MSVRLGSPYVKARFVLNTAFLVATFSGRGVCYLLEKSGGTGFRRYGCGGWLVAAESRERLSGNGLRCVAGFIEGLGDGREIQQG